MKKILLTVCAMTAIVAANAQIVTTRSSSVTTTYKESNDYSRSYLGWNTMSFDGVRGDFNGVTLGWLKGIGITSQPLFVEVGAEAAWTHYSYSNGYYSDEYTDDIIAAAIPISVTYKWDVNDEISLMPFTGPNFRFNIYDDETDSDYINLFQVGWNFGVGATFNNLYIGYKCTTNFNSYFDYDDSYDDDNGMYHMINIGYQF